MSATEIRHGHLFCGLGVCAKGFIKARHTLGAQTGGFRYQAHTMSLKERV